MYLIPKCVFGPNPDYTCHIDRSHVDRCGINRYHGERCGIDRCRMDRFMETGVLKLKTGVVERSVVETGASVTIIFQEFGCLIDAYKCVVRLKSYTLLSVVLINVLFNVFLRMFLFVGNSLKKRRLDSL